MTGIALFLIAAAVVVLPGASASARVRRPAVDAVTQATAAVDAAATFDVLAVCLRAGLPVADAAREAAADAPEPLGGVLLRAAELLALGADAQEAWRTPPPVPRRRWRRSPAGCAAAVEALCALARRSARAGSSPLAGLAEIAAAERSRRDDAAAAAAERAGVAVSGPLGLCFLPAFVCLGVAPVVVGLAGDVLGGALG